MIWCGLRKKKIITKYMYLQATILVGTIDDRNPISKISQ